MIEEYVTDIDATDLLDAKGTQCPDSDDGSVTKLAKRETRQLEQAAKVGHSECGRLAPWYAAHPLERSDDVLDAPHREGKRGGVGAMPVNNGVNVRCDGTRLVTVTALKQIPQVRLDESRAGRQCLVEGAVQERIGHEATPTIVVALSGVDGLGRWVELFVEESGCRLQILASIDQRVGDAAAVGELHLRARFGWSKHG
eukprot:1424982-Rhodomonas_salina.1